MQRSVAVAEGGDPLVVPEGGSFEGLLAFRGGAVIAGQLRGRVRARGRLRIRAGARVEARVEVDELIVEGRLRGDIRARERVELAPGAEVDGEIRAPRVQLAEGCRFTGRCCSGSAAEASDVSGTNSSEAALTP